MTESVSIPMRNPDWQTFLAAQGANFSNEVVQDFGDAKAELAGINNNITLCELGQFGVLKVSGADAQSFLNNMCSNDIKAITPSQAQLNTLNTAKGRVLASFLAWQDGENYFLHLPCGLLAAIQKKLSMYVLRSKVKIEDASTQTICLGFAGKEAAAWLQANIGEVPQTLLGITRHASCSILRVGADRFQINTNAEQATAQWQKLASAARPVGSACWDWLNIRAGVPVVLPETQEQFVLQMLNLDIIGGVSFKKGCYPGQEVVARMHYLGKPKQRTFLAHVETSSMPQPNAPLFSDDFPEKNSGHIVTAAPAPQGGYDVLASLHISTVSEQRKVHLGSADSAILAFEDLPYAFPPDKA